MKDHTYIRRDPQGAITHYQGIVEDITDRIEACPGRRSGIRHDGKKRLLTALRHSLFRRDDAGGGLFACRSNSNRTGIYD